MLYWGRSQPVQLNDGSPFQLPNDGNPFQVQNDGSPFQLSNDGNPFQVTRNNLMMVSQIMTGTCILNYIITVEQSGKKVDRLTANSAQISERHRITFQQIA